MIDKFEMFIALARERHFGRAAEASHVTQPSLSSAIRALEDFYGVALVQRGSRFIGLTPEGEKLLLRARAIVAEARAISSDLQDMAGDLEGVLRLGVIPTALTAVQDIAGPFLSAHPRARLDIRSMTSQGLTEAMADFQIDAGVSYAMDDSGRAPGGGLEFHPLYRESWAVVMAAKGAPARIGWEDLAGLRLCLLTQDMQNRRILDRILAARGIWPVPVVESTSILALISHMTVGAGEATVLPLHPARFLAQMPGLVCLPLPEDAANAAPEVGLIVPAEGRRGMLVAEFVKLGRTIGNADHATQSSI